MTTIYKSVPGQSIAIFEDLNESVRISGNELESIIVKNRAVGCTLYLDEIDSLKQVKINKPGLSVSFSKFPKQTVVINGPIEEVRITEEGETYNVHRFDSSPTLPIEDLWGTVITHDPSILSNSDSIILKTIGQKEVHLTQEFSKISLIGDDSLEEVFVSGKRLISNFTVFKGPQLKKLKINRRVLSCILKRCPNLDSVFGFGDRLKMRFPFEDNKLAIGGFWHEIPAQYNIRLAMLSIPHYNASLTAEEVQTCSDLGGVKIRPFNYNQNGGMIQFSTKLDLSIDEASHGVDIDKFVAIIEERGKVAFEAFSSWCDNELEWFDQYKAMRVLAALISRGYDSKAIIRLRNKLLELNRTTSRNLSGSVNDERHGGKWRTRHNNGENWSNPLDSFMPFCRIDLEIWLRTDLGLEFLILPEENNQILNRLFHSKKTNFREQNEHIRDLLNATLSAYKTTGRGNFADIKLSNLVKQIYKNPKINSDPWLCEFLIFHQYSSEEFDKYLINDLIDGISNMSHSSWKKAALLSAIISFTNSSRARMALKKLISDKSLSFHESSVIRSISIAGKRAFENNIAPNLDWPYLYSWRREISEKEV